MELSIIRIGNSKGLRLSKEILKRYNIKDKVELTFEEGQIIIKSIASPRADWAGAFKQMHEKSDYSLLIDDVFDDEDFEEWK
jgi:antitoxin MazE